MIMIDCPCKGCTDRWIDTETLTRCHSSCSKYAEYKKRTGDINSQLKEERNYKGYLAESHINFQKHKKSIEQLKRRKRLYRTA